MARYPLVVLRYELLTKTALHQIYRAIAWSLEASRLGLLYYIGRVHIAGIYIYV